MLGIGSPAHFKNNITYVVPSDLANLSIWLQNNTLVGAAGWEDNSGNNRDISQPEVGFRGVAIEGGLKLDGADNHYNWASSYLDMGGAQDFTLFVVFQRDGAASDSNTIIGGDIQNQAFFIDDEETIRFQTDNNDSVVSGAAVPTGQNGVNSLFKFPTDTWVVNEKIIMTVTKSSSGGFKWLKNGDEVSGIESGAGNTINIGQNLKIKHLGALDDGTDNPNDLHFHGTFHELIYYNTLLHSIALENINNYLRNKFAI